MKCDEFLKKLHENPLNSDKEMDDHVIDCPPCSREQDSVRALEVKMRAALQMNDDPLLTERLRKVPDANHGFWHLWLRPVMVFATLSIVFVALLAVYSGHKVNPRHHAIDLPELVVGHVQGEPESLEATEPVTAGRVAELLNELGAVLTHEIAGVVYAAPCLIREQRGLHLVIRDGRLAVSVLVMPGEHIQARQSVDDGMFSGVVTPTGYGSFAVVGTDQQSIDAIVRQVSAAVMWGV